MTATASTRPRTKSPAAGTPTNGELDALKARQVSLDESPEARSRQFLVAMVAFRDGDFSVRMPADWVGIDARIAEAFNQTIALLLSIAARKLAPQRARLSNKACEMARLHLSIRN